ncbi:hypothetical protein [Clostridium botulinum]
MKLINLKVLNERTKIMKKIYKFQVPQKIIDISSIILKDIDNQFTRQETEMLISVVCLQSLDKFPQGDIEKAIEELFRVLSNPINEDIMINLDKNFCNSENEKIKDIYLKYPIHNNIHDKEWGKEIINRYTSNLILIQNYIQKTNLNSDGIYNFIVAKDMLNKMISNNGILNELISLKNKKGLDRILKFKKIKEASKSIDEFKSAWDYYTNIVYKHISEDEKRKYEALLGERLAKA